MDIVVCIKQVVDTAATLRIQDGRVDTEGLARVLNPYDEFAVEEAVRIKARVPETNVTVLSLGPEKFKDTLRTGLAMGADRAVHLLDPAFEGLDGLGVARALALALNKLKFDLLLCGRQAVDDDRAQVGPALAVLLDLPCLTVVTGLELAPDHRRATVTRQIEGGSEVYEIDLPCLLTCQKGLNEPRLPSLKGIMAARKKTIEVWDAAAIGFAPEAAPPRVAPVDLSPPPPRQKGVRLDGSPRQAAAELVRRLRDEAKVI